jgi:hypothetical protein
MTVKEAKDWFSQESYVRCKETASDIIFDTTLWNEDTVLIRQASPDPVELYIISMDVFAKSFSAIGD